MVRRLRDRHQGFVGKYNLYVDKNINERMLERTTTFARLKLICKAFQEASVIDSYREVDVLGHSFSMAMISKLSPEPTYVLNDCSDVVVVSGGVASEDFLSGRIALVSGGAGGESTAVFKRYTDILRDDFEWETFADELLDILENSIYAAKQARRDFITDGLFGGK